MNDKMMLRRLVAVLEQKVLVYALDTLEMISTLDTLPNLRVSFCFL